MEGIRKLFATMSLLKKIKARLFPTKKEGEGYGTFFGVFLPGLLNMFGVTFFIRFSWILGSAGLPKTIAVLSLSLLITFITGLSLSAMATNRDVKGGGTYYMISRSLGFETGGTIGIVLVLIQVVGAAFCIIGFGEAVHVFFPSLPVKFIAIITLLGLSLIAFISTEVALKAQFFILFIIAIALISLFTGGGNGMQKLPELPRSTFPLTLWGALAAYFPVASGLDAGASLSGSLKEPRKSLPIGTLALLVTTYFAYLALAFFLHKHVATDHLVSNPQILYALAKVKWILIAGVFFAILSTSLTSIISAPRTLQALAKDGIFPRFIAKESGKSKEPKIAGLICLVFIAVLIFYGSLELIAPILTMFLLMAFAILNIGAALEDLLGNPSWRPTFQVPWPVTLSGSALCLFSMFMIDAGVTFTGLFLIGIIFFFVKRCSQASSWGDIRQGIMLFLSRHFIYRMRADTPSARSWRPNFLAFTETPSQVTNMINFTSAITRKKGFLTLASVFSTENADTEKVGRWKGIIQNYLQKHDVHALVELRVDKSLISGVEKFITSYGLGPIAPNTIVLGEESIESHPEIIAMTHAAKKNVIVIRENQEKKVEWTRKGLGDIDIWWDDDSRTNSELMLLLAYMLKQHPLWKWTKIHVKSFVPTEQAREQRLSYFRSFFQKSRLNVSPEVYLNEDGEENVYKMIHSFSKKREILFISLRPPFENEGLDSYKTYYHNLLENTKNLPTVAYVLSSQSIDLKEIFD